MKLSSACERRGSTDRIYSRSAVDTLLVFSGIRYFMTCVNDDYVEAMSILDEIVASGFPGDDQDDAKLVVAAQKFTLLLPECRARTFQTPEYLEEAMYRTRALRNEDSVKEYFDLFEPELTAGERFGYFGSNEDLDGWYDSRRQAETKLLAKYFAKQGDGLGNTIGSSMRWKLFVFGSATTTTQRRSTKQSKREELYTLHIFPRICRRLSRSSSTTSVKFSLKDSGAQARSTTLTNRLALSVKLLGAPFHKLHSSCAISHSLHFP
ncbi:hypothetical protein EI94DRAFT_1177683 [Lactarius quietus]|nr:hypothetical protein EI94DRAFT_1177683 [Lactarius quietus]